MTLHLTHPADCLPHDPTQPDIGILCAANDVARMSLRLDIPSDASRTLAHIAAELRDRAGDVRALGQRMSQKAADLIQLLHRASSEGDAWAVLVDCATTIRGLSDADRGRVASEALIALARQREPGK